MSEDVERRIRVLLAAQVSLLGAVGPNLRAVTCSWSDSDIQICAILDLAISDLDAESMDEVETEMMSHFPDSEVMVRCVRIDAPLVIDIQPNEVFIFKRREQSSLPE